jgi:hypothetical protein
LRLLAHGKTKATSGNHHTKYCAVQTCACQEDVKKKRFARVAGRTSTLLPATKRKVCAKMQSGRSTASSNELATSKTACMSKGRIPSPCRSGDWRGVVLMVHPLARSGGAAAHVPPT